jgi:hypothetical protein
MNIAMGWMRHNEMESAIVEAEYGEEIMCAEWNPAVIQLFLQSAFLSPCQQADLPIDLATKIDESFLQRIYAHQR